MEAPQITDALKRMFDDEQVRVVFWNDPEREFIESLPDVTLDGVKVINLDDIGALEVKVRIEKNDPDGRYLLYSPAEVSLDKDDWLLDMRLYGRSFRADRASIILQELGLDRLHLGTYITSRKRFFDSKQRLQKLKGFISSADSELDLDRKMLAVIAKADHPELFTVVRTLFHSIVESEGDEPDLDASPQEWTQIEKFGLDEPFWQMIDAEFGYSESAPTLRNLLIRLLVSDYNHHLADKLPNALQHFLLPDDGARNAVVFLGQWRDSSSKGRSYSVLATEVGSRLKMPSHLYSCEVEALLDVITFPDVEKRIVQGLLERVTSMNASLDPEAVCGIVARRQSGYWVTSGSLSEAQRNSRRAIYEALAVASQFLDLHHEYEEGFDFLDMTEMYRGYETKLFRFDQLYRHFCANADVASAQGEDTLKALRKQIEDCYCHRYLARLELAWGKFVDETLPERWSVKGVASQHHFFVRFVKSKLNKADKRRVFVIISDALRYEIAEELTGRLNGAYRFQAELSSQLGVLPSYTALGMASLLPHGKLEYTAKGGVLADGQPTASLEQRNAILGNADGIAVKTDHLLSMKKQEGRAFIADKRIVYIYHSRIDAYGDKAATESDTFKAVGESIQELADLVRHVVNNLNGNHVVITADHGFLFTDTPPSTPDRSKLEVRPDNAVTTKKRYLLGYDLPLDEYAWRGETAVTAGAEGDMQFWIPKGNNLFHFMGGARFVHGGAMLQEIVVPVIEVKHIKSKSGRETTRSKSVTVQVLETNHRITAPKHRFRLLQMEPVGDRTKPITLKVAVYEGDTPVTSIETLTFDSTSLNLDEREKSVMLTLQDRAYDKRALYRLILRDAATGIEQVSLDVIIDRAIIDDFDF